tara:strand:- start:322 stop:450 length:129 start_codon:yes stop_codon:yes gene_type:complete
MALKKKKAGAKKAPAKVRQKKLPIPGSAIHKSMVSRGLIKEK